MLVAWALLVTPATAHGGNDDEVLLGNQAATTGGAVTATIHDGGALWYNPSGLAAVDESRLDVSASAFTLRTLRLGRIMQATTGESADLNLTELVTVPSTLSYVRPLSDRLRLGFGVFVRRMSDFTGRQTLELSNGTERSEWVGLLSAASASYVLSAGAALEAMPGLRVGLALYTLYDSRSGTSQLAGGVHDGPGVDSSLFLTATELFSHQSLGVRLGVGVQWHATDRLRLGVTAHTPSYVVYRTGRRAVVVTGLAEGSGGGATGLYAPSDTTLSSRGLEPSEPPQLRAGAAYVADRFSVAIDGDLRPGLRNREIGVQRGLVANARVGGTLHVVDDVQIGAGLFTDLNSHERLGFADLGVDFYGFTAGVSYSNGYDVEEEQDDDEPSDSRPEPGGQRLTFATTLALRYAYGHGHVGGLRVRPTFASGDEGASDSVQLGEARVHEITVHVGSGFRF